LARLQDRAELPRLAATFTREIAAGRLAVAVVPPVIATHFCYPVGGSGHSSWGTCFLARLSSVPRLCTWPPPRRRAARAGAGMSLRSIFGMQSSLLLGHPQSYSVPSWRVYRSAPSFRARPPPSRERSRPATLQQPLARAAGSESRPVTAQESWGEGLILSEPTFLLSSGREWS